MNNYFNFQIPYFNDRYGEDWDSFKTIVDDNVDYAYAKVEGLYWLNDIDRTTVRAVEKALQALKIPFDATDTVAAKKAKLKTFVSKYADKGLAQPYIDLAYAVTGLAGEFTMEWERGGWIWGEASWYDGVDADEDTITWGASVSQFVVYFDVKTTDNNELDLIQSLLRDKSMKPAFYQIYLTDSSFNILRTI